MKKFNLRAGLKNMTLTVFVSLVCALTFSTTAHASEAEHFIPFRSYLMSYCTSHAAENDDTLIKLWEKLMVEETQWNNPEYEKWSDKYFSEFVDLDGQTKSSKGITFTYNEELAPFFYTSISNNSALVPEYLSHEQTYEIIMWYLRRGFDVSNPGIVVDVNCTEAVKKSTAQGEGLDDIDKYSEAVEAYIRIMVSVWDQLSDIQKEWILSHTDVLNRNHEENKNSENGSIIQNNHELYDATARSEEGANSEINQQEFFDYVIDSGEGLGDFIDKIEGVKEELSGENAPETSNIQTTEDLFGGDGDCKSGCQRCDGDGNDFDAKAYEIAFGKSAAMVQIRNLIENNENSKNAMAGWIAREWAIHTPFVEVSGQKEASAKTDGTTDFSGTNSGTETTDIFVSKASAPEFYGKFQVFGAEIEKIECNSVEGSFEENSTEGNWELSMGEIFSADGIYDLNFKITDSTGNSYSLNYKTGRDTTGPGLETINLYDEKSLDAYDSENAFLSRNAKTDHINIRVTSKDELTAVRTVVVKANGVLISSESHEKNTTCQNDSIKNIAVAEYKILLQEDTMTDIEIVTNDALGNENSTHRFIYRTTVAGDLDTAGCQKSLTANGTDQALINQATSSTGTVVYSVDGENWAENIPTGKHCGDYKVYIKALENDSYNESETVEMDVTIDHNSDGVATTPSSCTSNGEQHNYCTSCGGNICNSRVLPLTGHSYSVTDWSPGNCQMRAFTTYRCNNCGHSYTNTGDYGSHQWGDEYREENLWDGNYTGTSSSYRQCKICGKREQTGYYY